MIQYQDPENIRHMLELLDHCPQGLQVAPTSECDVPVPGIPVPGNLSLFLMVSEPVSKKFGTEKSLGISIKKIWYRNKSRNRSRKILVPKKVPESVSKKFGTEKSRNRGQKKFGTEKSQNQT